MTSPPDQANAPAPARPLAARWSVALAAFAIGMNVTVMSVVVADLRSSFPTARLSTLGWVVTAYTIVFGAVLVPAGRVADRLGRRSVFLAGLVVFAAGYVVSGIGPTLWLVIAGRVVQGIGAACVLPAAMALLLAATPVGERAAASAFYTAASSIGTAAGPSIGALVVDVTNWRLAFFLGIPFLAGAYVLGRRSLPPSVARREAALPDLTGAVLLMAGMAGITFAVGQGRPWGWGHAAVVGASAAAVVLLPLFVWRSARHPSPVMPVALFRRRSFAAANVAALALGAATGGISLANVLFLRDVWDYRLLVAGLAGLPGPVAAFTISRGVGRLGVRFGEAAVGVPGALCLVASMAWLRLFAGADANYWTGFFPGAVLLGMGIAGSLSMVASAVVRGIETDQLSLAAASNRSFLQLGNAVGIAVAVGLLASTDAALRDYQLLWTCFGVLAVGCAAATAAIGPRSATGATVPAPRPAAASG